MLFSSCSTLKESRSMSADKVLTSGMSTYMLWLVSSVSPSCHLTSLKLIPALIVVLYVYMYLGQRYAYIKQLKVFGFNPYSSGCY